MQSKLLHEDGGKRTFAVILEQGDEVVRCLQEFAVKESIGGAQMTAIGALSNAKLAFFDWETKQYQPIPVEEQVEVASLVGDIAIGPDRQPSIHVHAVLGSRDGTALAGHLQERLRRDPLPPLAFARARGYVEGRMTTRSEHHGRNCSIDRARNGGADVPPAGDRRQDLWAR